MPEYTVLAALAVVAVVALDRWLGVRVLSTTQFWLTMLIVFGPLGSVLVTTHVLGSAPFARHPVMVCSDAAAGFCASGFGFSCARIEGLIANAHETINAGTSETLISSS